jgi:hypothetical protein
MTETLACVAPEPGGCELRTRSVERGETSAIEKTYHENTKIDDSEHQSGARRAEGAAVLLSTMAGKRLPLLAFVASFLLAFNVFRNQNHGHLPHTRGGGRVDPTTVTTASFVPSADGQSILGVLPEKAGRFSTGDGKRRDDTASGTTVESVVKPPRPIPREATSGAQTSTETTSTHPHPFLPKPHSEYGGDVVKWGSTFLVDSERACHDACVAHVNDEPIGCNVWVYCPSIDGCGNDQPHKACWLKHQSRPENPVGQIDDPHNKWTSGSMSTPSDTRGERGVHKKFHVVVTTNANVYQAWQVRVMYYWYLKMKEAQGPDGQMGGFTRVLHDDKDALVDEIPTCVVDRLDNEYGFVVLSRPNAFVEFFKKCGDIEEDYILMAEPDHLYLKVRVGAFPNPGTHCFTSNAGDCSDRLPFPIYVIHVARKTDPFLSKKAPGELDDWKHTGGVSVFLHRPEKVSKTDQKIRG